MTRSLTLPLCIAVISLTVLLSGLAYGLTEVARHGNPDCGKTSSRPPNAPPGPDPCARSEDDWHRATWLFIVPGLAGSVAASGLAVVRAGIR